jgi:CheY-like chemotaxis protein
MERPIGIGIPGMSEMVQQPRIIIVDDEEEWRSKLSKIVADHVPCEILTFASFESADRYITINDMTTISAALLDIRLRKQIFDQGGLALLSLIKERNEAMPVLVLTAYSYDYPGLREITKRFPSVLTYDKEVFEDQPKPILDSLLAILPPQIGDGVMKKKRLDATSAPDVDTLPPKQTRVAFGEIIAGALVVGFVLGAALLFFLLSSRFTEFSRQLNVVFSVLMVALIAVLIRVFKPAVITQSVSVYKDLLAHRRGGEAINPPAKPPRRKKIEQKGVQQQNPPDEGNASR